jgi:hypothetical protein
MLLEDKKNRPFIKAHNAGADRRHRADGGIVWIVGPFSSAPAMGMVPALACEVLIPAIKAFNGQMVEIPVISNFVRQQGW